MTARKSPSRRRCGPDDRGSDDIDAYLAGRPDQQRRALEQVREAIRAAAPDAIEAFIYGVPGFKLDGKALACYAGFTHHCGFYPMSPEAIAAHASELEGYELSKGTIRFAAEAPLPAALVGKLVTARAAEIRGGSGGRRGSVGGRGSGGGRPGGSTPRSTS